MVTWVSPPWLGIAQIPGLDGEAGMIICPPTLDTSDHGCIAVASYVPDVVPNADGTAFLEHVLCGMRRCASNLSLVLKHEQQLTST
eukprot:scaffold55837_cov15-Tisochrysis_lutea.AAC.1